MSKAGFSFFEHAAPGIFVLLWSTGFIGAKLGLPYAEPLTFLEMRFIVVCTLLLSLALALRRPWPKSPRQALHIAIAGVFLHGGYLGGVFGAIHRGMPAGLVALIVGMQPLLTAMLGGKLLGERVGPKQWTGLLLGFVGVALVLSGKLALAGLSFGGMALTLLALLSITCGTIYQKRFCGQMDLWTGSLIQFVAAGLVFLPFMLIYETMQITWNRNFIFALGWLVLVLSLGAISLLHQLIRHGAATRVSALFYLTPPTTALLAWAVFGEQLDAPALVGMALAAFGVALALRK
ncbi:MAG: DMT family transporter [Betaproteobacteria bacterium]|nr:DMT family transporter [Betaproteobacteria bacterium]